MKLKKWTEKEVKLLKKIWPNSTKEEIVRTFSNHPYKGIKFMASKLGLKKKVILRKKLIKITPLERAYIAGFIDGEGCISAHFAKDEYRNRPRITLDITNTDRSVIDKINKILPCSIYVVKPKRLSKRISYRLRISSLSILLPFFKAIKKYSIVKRKQIELVIKLLEIRKDMNRGETASKKEIQIVKKIQSFNKRSDI